MRWLWMLLAVGLAGSLLTGVHEIRPGERAIIRRFGRILEEKPVPGLWFGLPWGMDRVDRVPVHRVRRLEVGYVSDAERREEVAAPDGQLVTGDHNLVNIRVAVDYAVGTGDEDLVQYVLHEDRLEGLLSRCVEGTLAEWLAARPIDALLIRGKADLPDVLARAAQEAAGRHELGIQVQGASVVSLLPPDEVRAAFDDVTRAHTEVRTREEQAFQAAARRVAGAQAERYTAEQRAQTDAQALRVRAAAEAQTFERRLAEYRRLSEQNPDALSAIWWDHMSRLLRGMRENGRVDLLDNHLGGDGLDITVMPALPKKK